MASKSKKQHDEKPRPPVPPSLKALAEENQLDFELKFFSAILEANPDFVDVLKAMSNILTLKGRVREGLEIDRRLVRLRPGDPLAHYNLACSYSLLQRPDPALKALRRAIELGYRNFRYMKQDRDLDGIRKDPRFRQLIREFEKPAST